MALNPKAKSFVFNPGASTFSPGGNSAPAPEPTPEPKKEEKAPANWDDEVAVTADKLEATKVEDEPEAEPEPTAEELAELAAIEAEEKAFKAAKAKEQKAAAAAEFVPVSGKKNKKQVAEYKEHDSREHLNLVFIGHVDAGKSTITGQLLLLTGQVDERTIAKYEKEAKEKNRESWYLAYVMDTSEEERAKGKTVEVGRAHFATANKRYTLLDAPGHKNYVPNMIEGTAQADVGVLVISARKGEFETGFDRGGQTREHAMLAKTLGIQRLIVLVNKMDEPTVKWDKGRYDQIEEKLTPFLKSWGYNVKEEVIYIPCSGYTGANLKDKVAASVCDWYKGESFITILNQLKPINRNGAGKLRIPIIARYRDMGNLVAIGKIEQGTIQKDQKLYIEPNGIEATCTALQIEDEMVDMATAGENVCIQLKGISEEDVHGGFVISHKENPCNKTLHFEAQIVVLELLEHKPLLTSGYECILHIHTHSSECVVAKLITAVDRKTGKPQPGKPRYIKQNGVCLVRISLQQSVALEVFKDCQQLGRFTLRDEGKTVAIGKVTKLLTKKSK